MAEELKTFDGGTPGNNVAAGFNDIDAITGVPVYIAGLHGTTAVRTGGAANTTDTSVRVVFGGGISGNHAGSVYVKYNTDHGSGSASANFLVIVASGNAFIAEFRCGAGNEFGIRITSTNLYTGPANSVPLNAWFRIDWILTGTSLQVRLYEDPDADAADTPDISTTVTVGSSTSAAVFLKATSSSAIIKDFSFDTFRVKDSLTWWDHYDPTPPGGDSGVTVWNGTAEVEATVTVWNGTSEVAATAEYTS